MYHVGPRYELRARQHAPLSLSNILRPFLGPLSVLPSSIEQRLSCLPERTAPRGCWSNHALCGNAHQTLKVSRLAL